MSDADATATLRYTSGDEIRKGDRIRYNGEQGQVVFLVMERIGDPAHDWYLDQFPGGGLMIEVEEFGNVFLGVADIDDDLELVARA